jgi:polyhydroxyalkanoate synthesis regulator phasin
MMEMMNLKTRNRIISAVIAGSVVLSLGGIAFAETSNSAASGTARTEQRGNWEKGSFRRGQKAPMQKNGSMFKSFVTDGTISQEQADKIDEYIKTKMEAKKAEFEQMKDKTKEEREAFFEQQKTEKQDMLDEIVKANIITQDQLDKIKAKMPQFGNRLPMGQQGNKLGMKGGNFAAPQERQQDLYRSAVEKGTITQEKADKIYEFMKQKTEEQKAKFEEMKNMTVEERAELRKQPKEWIYFLS